MVERGQGKRRQIQRQRHVQRQIHEQNNKIWIDTATKLTANSEIWHYSMALKKRVIWNSIGNSCHFDIFLTGTRAG